MSDKDPGVDGYEIKNEAIELLLRRMAGTIKQAMPEGWGFSLFLFNYGEESNTFYISTAQREDFLRGLSEFMARHGYITSLPNKPSDSVS